MATLLFKTYFSVRLLSSSIGDQKVLTLSFFQLRSTALCKNLIKGIEAAHLVFGNLPKSHRVRPFPFYPCSRIS